MTRRKPCKHSAMIRVWSANGIDMLYIEYLPGWFTGLQKNVIEAMAEKDAAPGPMNFMS